VLRVYLKDGARLKVEASLDEFERALEEAAQRSVLVRVHSSDGKTFGISPSNVSLIESDDADAMPNGGGSVRSLAQTSR
jgi:hypothetical protein